MHDRRIHRSLNHNGLTAAATVFAKFLNSGEDVSERAGVKVCDILNSNLSFGFAGAAVVVAARNAK